MRVLRYVRPDDGGDGGESVIVEIADGGGSEQFLLRVDAQLREAVRSDLPRLPAERPAPAVAEVPEAEPELAITPREIQIRVRSGEAPEAVAEAQGISLERVLRFAGPVMDERNRIADEARRARARRSTSEGQVVVFGEAVDARFSAHGIDPAEVSWDARRRDDGQWIVVANWLGGTSDRRAEWLFHLSARNVTPIDDTAADLLSDRPIRPIVPPAPHDKARAKLTVAPPPAPGVVAFPAMPDAHTGPLPRREDVFDQDAPDPDAPRRPAARAVVVEPDYDSPQLPLHMPGGAAVEAAPQPRVTNLGIAHREEESEEERAARARIPSWDDILLGVRRKRD